MRRTRWRNGLAGVGCVLTLAVAALGASRLSGGDARVGRATALVRRGDLNVILTAGGRVESTEQTIIECELENLAVGVRGQSMVASGSSTILSLVPEGTTVRKGDVLCRLDASDYEEMVRQQKMTVERAKADLEQAKLVGEVASLSVREFRDGTLMESRKDFGGQLAMARADWERANDRLAWTRRMVAKGYVPKSQVLSDELTRGRAAFSYTQARTAREVFERYSVPMTIRILESDVLAAEVMRNYQERRLQRHRDRLADLERQVERCTIRAPHAGFLIYHSEDFRDVRIEEGSAVHQRQRLFYLPDLNRMEIVTLVHESVARRVRPGLLARVRVEGVPNGVVEGHVTSVAQLPSRNFFSDVRYFVAHVRLDTFPGGVRPGMTAEVEIATTNRRDVLTVPTDALVFEAGHDFCYVAHEDSLERREVQVGEATRESVEVSAGLSEGEEVVLAPSHHEGPNEQIAEAGPEPMTEPNDRETTGTAE